MQTAARGTDSKIVGSEHQCIPAALPAILIAKKAVSYPIRRISTQKKPHSIPSSNSCRKEITQDNEHRHNLCCAPQQGKYSHSTHGDRVPD